MQFGKDVNWEGCELLVWKWLRLSWVELLDGAVEEEVEVV